MSIKISPDTHKQYHIYSFADARKILNYIFKLEMQAKKTKPLYHEDTYCHHAQQNYHKVKAAICVADIDKTEDIRIPASILFWLVRSAAHFNLRCPVTLPHICKAEVGGKERFFVTTKEEWSAHRKAHCKQSTELKYTDHAKMNYLERVLGMDVDSLMSDAPRRSLEKAKGTKLKDGRVLVKHQKHQYILNNKVCVSVLDESMQVE